MNWQSLFLIAIIAASIFFGIFAHHAAIESGGYHSM